MVLKIKKENNKEGISSLQVNGVDLAEIAGGEVAIIHAMVLSLSYNLTFPLNLVVLQPKVLVHGHLKKQMHAYNVFIFQLRRYVPYRAQLFFCMLDKF
ncbi:hypothetical protein Pint_17770 [Pistacia integerrima]|uniref:Uncharacterized protein n=1 Tax=Pistacia integerrima TaxID=434235 RepID=A0ACC0Z003_9ROSI|nr:hypothetical protein Pint_17770 [Pistacia integerrima]